MIAFRQMSFLRYAFCTKYANKTYQKTVTSYNSFTFDVINHYDQICKIKGKGAILSLMPCYPQYQVTKTGTLVVKMKYSRNYIYLWRFQPIPEVGKEVNNKESLNFPISYENCGNILDLCDQLKTNPEMKLEETTVKGNLTFNISINYQQRQAQLSLATTASQQQPQVQDQRFDVQVSLAQLKLICEQMKQGLPLVTGWLIPEKFLVEMNKEKQE